MQILETWEVYMSYAVATMKKLKSSDLGGIQIESDRQYDDPNAYKNEVDLSRSHLNLELIDTHDHTKGGLKRETETYINANKVSERKIRKDAVVLNSWIITSDQSFFESLSHNQQVQFFKDASDWFTERYGVDNVMHATIHFDETTPHMHMGIVPLREGRLTSKTIITPIELAQVQEKFPDFMASKGWSIERGMKGSERKHLDAPEYRAATEQAKEIKAQNKQLMEQNKALQDELKDEALDVLEELMPNVAYNQDAYDHKKSSTTDKDAFVASYGEKAKPVTDPQGRKQLKDWTALSELQKLVKECVERLKNQMQKFKEKYDELQLEIKELKNEKSVQEKELNELREIYGEKKTEKTQGANDFFENFAKQVDTEQREKKLKSQYEHERKLRNQQDSNNRDMGGFSR